MRLTKKAEYAIRAMVDLAANDIGRPVKAKDVAARQDIPQEFLAHVVSELKGAGLIRTVRGNSGGIFLNNNPSEITVRHVVEVIEGPIALNDCLLGERGCARKSSCPLHGMWHEAQTKMLSVLEATTLAELAGLKKPAIQTAANENAGRISNEMEIDV